MTNLLLNLSVKKHSLKYFLMGFVLVGLFVPIARAQTVNADPFTGALRSTIPVYTIQRGAITVPIGLSYYGNGVKVKATEGNAGVNWNVNAGGAVYRELRDLPDEVNEGAGIDSRKGWIYSGYASKIANFSIANDNSKSTCPDETGDIAYLDTNFPYLWDMEPDIFRLQAPGLSASLVFDQNDLLIPMGDADLKVDYELSSYGISRIEVITNAGLKYVFSEAEHTSKTTQSASPSSISYFKREYDLYKNSIDYYSAWHLTSITDLNGNTVSFTYTDQAPVNNVTNLGLYIGTSTIKTHQYKITESGDPKLLSMIKFAGKPDNYWTYELDFSYVLNPSTNVYMVSQINLYSYDLKPLDPNQLEEDLVRSWSFGYVKASDNPNSGYKRYFLGSFGSGRLERFVFGYYGITDNGIGYSVDLPDSSSSQLDMWGYYNGANNSNLCPVLYINPSNAAYDRFRIEMPGSLSSVYPYSLTGASRSVAVDKVKTGMLSQISYKDGGFTTIAYEPQQYYDAQSGLNVVGGGVRVKSITDNDAESSSTDRVRTFEYINPSTNKSSGAPISLPQLAFVRPYTGSGTTQSRWQNSVVRSDKNLSKESDAIVYSHVRVMTNTDGSTLYTLSRPATHFDNSSPPDWQPTWTYVARDACANIGFLTGGEQCFPYAPNLDFGFERGLLLKKTVYNQSGQKVREISNIYSRSYTPTLLYGMKMETMGAAVIYSKYPIMVKQGKLIDKRTVVNYNATNGAVQDSRSVNYVYGSTHHRLPTQVFATESDGSVERTYTKYLKDYNLATASDNPTIAMKQLSNKNVNIPIETYTNVVRGGIAKTVSARLLKLKPFSINNTTHYLPSQRLFFQNATGAANFQVSSVNNGNFISDSRYWVTENYTHYGSDGLLYTSDDNNGNIKTVLYDGYLPHARAAGIRADELSVNTFEGFHSDVEHGLHNETTSIFMERVESPRSGKKALKIKVGQIFAKSMKKKPGTQNYILSFWANTGTSAVVTAGMWVGGTLSQNVQISTGNTSNTWKFYQKSIPVAALPTEFTFKLQSSQEILLDDILFYPEDGSLTTATYNIDLAVKTSETSANGHTRFYVYDQYGRLRNILNDDKDILVASHYVNQYDNMTVSISHDGIASNKTITFSSDGSAPSEEGIQYTWDFGDGSAPVTTSSKSIQHVYTVNGDYTVSVSKYSPLYGSVTDSETIHVTPYDITVDVSIDISELSGCQIDKIDFYQGTTMVESFSRYDLTAGNAEIVQGAYTAKVYTSGEYNSTHNPDGFKKVSFKTQPSGEPFCRASGSEPYSFYIDLAQQTSIRFRLEADECTPPIIIIP